MCLEFSSLIPSLTSGNGLQEPWTSLCFQRLGLRVHLTFRTDVVWKLRVAIPYGILGYRNTRMWYNTFTYLGLKLHIYALCGDRLSIKKIQIIIFRVNCSTSSTVQTITGALTNEVLSYFFNLEFLKQMLWNWQKGTVKTCRLDGSFEETCTRIPLQLKPLVNGLGIV